MGQIKNKNLIGLKATSNCWICEGWTEFKFIFKPKEEIDAMTTPIQLHISSDQYQGELLERDTTYIGEIVYSTTRMVPPGEATYYFSINGIPEVDNESAAIESTYTKHSRKL